MSEKGHNSINYDYGIYLKFNQVIYILDTNCVLNIMILAKVVLQIFSLQCPHMAKMPKSGKKPNSVKCSKNFMES